MKSVYYFPHDFNASQDPKLIKLQRAMNGDGLAIFWKLIERLGPETGHRLPDTDDTYTALEWDMHFAADDIKRVVREFNLFVIEDGYFFSKRLTESLRAMEESREKRRSAGSLGGRAKAANREKSETGNNSNATQDFSNATQDCSTAAQNCSKEIKENKESKEIKEKKGKKETPSLNDDNKKNIKKEKNESHKLSELVTDEEYIGITRSMMIRLAAEPCKETDGLINLMHPQWKGKYDDYSGNKPDAATLWTVERKNKYLNQPSALTKEKRDIDFFLGMIKDRQMFDRELLNTYRGLQVVENDRQVDFNILIAQIDDAKHIDECWATDIFTYLRTIYPVKKIILKYIVKK